MSNLSKAAGRLRIGDDWNAITIIALSQSNPLKAVAEFVENSLDARARHVTITRGRDGGVHYLRIQDDGLGVPRDTEGRPDFKFVATHICDSIKRRLKAEGARGIQGEFGIGLLSFWTIGEELLLSCAGADGHTYQMRMRKGDPSYEVVRRRVLVAGQGTDLVIRNILPGIRQFSGEKIQWYLASELRDRIRTSGVEIRVVDRTARAEFRVEPRQFEGQLLHDLHKVAAAPRELYLELYLGAPGPDRRVELHRSGTRVLGDLADLEPFRKSPWTSGYLQGLVDAPYLQLTPGTRLGVLHDAGLERLALELAPVEAELLRRIEAVRHAEEERTSREVLRSIQSALKEALLALPAEEYDWFNVRSREGEVRRQPVPAAREDSPAAEADASPVGDSELHETPTGQLRFFEHAGPLFSVRISPASCVVPVGRTRGLHSVCRDRSRRLVEENLEFEWRILDGGGAFDRCDAEIVEFRAPAEPGLTRVAVTVTQGEIRCEAEGLITVTDSLLPAVSKDGGLHAGIPGYTLENAPGRLWRSRFDEDQNVIVVNSGHRDFVYAARSKALKVRYLCRLFAKELVLRNFTGIPPDQLLERLIELTLYTEENLR